MAKERVRTIAGLGPLRPAASSGAPAPPKGCGLPHLVNAGVNVEPPLFLVSRWRGQIFYLAIF